MKKLVILFQMLALLALVAPGARAGVVIDYTLDTSPLVGHAAAPFYAAFQFFDISLNPGNNSATVSNFNFGGGSAVGGSEILGAGTSGDLSSTVSLSDVDPLSILPGDPIGFVQQFTPGNSLSFRVTFNDLVVADGDAFTFQILENNNGALFGGIPGIDLITITTDDPNLSDGFLLVNLDSTTTPSIGSFGHTPNLLLPPSVGSDFALGPGTATLQQSNNQVPEPASLAVFAVGAVVVGLGRMRRKIRSV